MAALSLFITYRINFSLNHGIKTSLLFRQNSTFGKEKTKKPQLNLKKEDGPRSAGEGGYVLRRPEQNQGPR